MGEYIEGFCDHCGAGAGQEPAGWQLKDRPPGIYCAVRCLVCGAIYYGRRYSPDAWDTVQVVTEQLERADRLEMTGDWWPLPPGVTPAQQIAQVEGYYDLLVKRLTTYRPTKGRLVEVGPGIGRFARIAQAGGWEVIGIEPDVAAAGVCSRYVRTIVGRLDQVAPSSIGPVDAVVMLDVLEHTHSPFRDLKMLRGLATPGCVFLGKTFKEDHEKGPWYRAIGHEWHLTRAQWERWISDAGWHIWLIEDDDSWGQITIWGGVA